jgi:folate-binding protein YgfZ
MASTDETPGYRALHDTAAWMDLDARGRLIARGRDRARFLHNVTSNEVKKLSPGAGCYAFLLTPQGRIQADLYLLCFEDHFLIDTEADLRQKVPGLILKYKVADQVELEDVTEQMACVAVEGPNAESVLAACGAPVPAADCAHAAWGEATVARISLTGPAGFHIFCASGRKAGLVAHLEAAGVARATDEDARVVRIENGKPRYGEDIVETSLPQETQQMQAVSFTKGCYLGQEIVERIRAQGRVNWKLARVGVEGEELVGPGTKVAAEGTEAGEVTSSVYSPRQGKVAAIARLRAIHAESGSALSVEGRSAVVL